MENKKEILATIERLEEQLNSSLKELQALRARVEDDYENENASIEEMEDNHYYETRLNFIKQLWNMEIPLHVHNAISRSSINSMEELINTPCDKLLEIRGLDTKGLEKLKTKLREQGIELE